MHLISFLKKKKNQNLLEESRLLKKAVRSAITGGRRTRRHHLETGFSAVPHRGWLVWQLFPFSPSGHRKQERSHQTLLLDIQRVPRCDQRTLSQEPRFMISLPLATWLSMDIRLAPALQNGGIQKHQAF